MNYFNPRLPVVRVLLYKWWLVRDFGGIGFYQKGKEIMLLQSMGYVKLSGFKRPKRHKLFKVRVSSEFVHKEIFISTR